MWPVSTGWRAALTGDLTTTVRASVLYEGAETWTDDGPEIRDLTVRTWLAGGDKSQICTEATLTIGDGAVPVEGSAADVLAWLTGRSDGVGLATAGDVPLPALPSWG